MNRDQEEMQLLGFVGVFQHSSQTILAERKTFSKITHILILPLVFIFLLHTEVTATFQDSCISRAAAIGQGSADASDTAIKELANFLLIEFACLVLVAILGLLSKSVVVYSVACIYTSKEVTFKGVMSVVPKVWKKLVVSFFCVFILFFALTLATLFAVAIWLYVIGSNNAGVAGTCVLLMIYLVYVVYLSVICELAYTVSVLEDAQGFPAISKSRRLMKGKIWLCVAVSLGLGIPMAVTNMAFKALVVKGSSIYWRISYGLVCVAVFSIAYLFALVAQTITYLVCKSYHHEKIDKSELSDHLEVYTHEYVPLTSKAVQMENYDVV